MKRLLPLLGPFGGLVFLAGLAYLTAWPVPIEPGSRRAEPFEASRWAPAPFPAATRVEIAGGAGPEDLDVDRQGRVYGGLADGRILRWPAGGGEPEVFADTGGRPLGLHWDRHGNLIVADALKGLLSVDPRGEVELLTVRCGGRLLGFADDVDVDARGRIWFSDASTKFGQSEWRLDLLEGNANGRLCRYQPGAKEAEEVLGDLFFPNGVAVDPAQRFVLVNETSRYRVIRVPLDAPGDWKVHVEGLPGFPDGISAGTGGVFWVAIANPRNSLLDAAADKPWLRKMIARVPEAWGPSPVRTARVLGIDAEGEVVHDSFDPEGRDLFLVTSVQERDGRLYLGSLRDHAWAHLPVPGP